MRHVLLTFLVGLGACSDSGLSKHNAEPSAAIRSHTDGDQLQSGASVDFRGTVGDPDDNLGSLLARWSLDGTDLCTAVVPESDGSVTCTTTAETGGTLQLEVVDPSGASSIDAISLGLVEDLPPTAVIDAPTGS